MRLHGGQRRSIVPASGRILLHRTYPASQRIGTVRRVGLGKVRHLATADLWIQDRIRKKDFSLDKVLGAENPSDMLTKHADRGSLHKHMSNLGLHCESGRAQSAPSIDH